jgi:hypothetical protein
MILTCIYELTYGPRGDKMAVDWRNCIIVTAYNYNDQVKEDEIERACCKHGREKEWIQNFDWKT